MTDTMTPNGLHEGPTEEPNAASLKDAAAAQVNDLVEQAQDSFDKAVSQGSDELERLGRQSSTFVRENPGLALAGAAGIGLLIGLAISKRI
ncbi:MAG: hypothetical protein AAFQ50_00430 [Pseudomonadota bacterium]